MSEVRSFGFVFGMSLDSFCAKGGRRINRTLTQKYDMNALRALQKLETQLTEQLSANLGVEEDELPVEIDLLRIYNLEVGEREKELVQPSN